MHACNNMIKFCKKKQRCAKCADKHHIEECMMSLNKRCCINCNEDHELWRRICLKWWQQMKQTSEIYRNRSIRYSKALKYNRAFFSLFLNSLSSMNSLSLTDFADSTNSSSSAIIMLKTRRLIVESSFDINLLTRLKYSVLTFWLDLISILSRYSIRILDSTHQEIENDVKCQDLLFLNLLRHYIWKTYVKQMNLFLFSLFALSCCIINKIYCKMSDSDKAYELSRSSIEKEFNFLIVHSSTFSSFHSNEFVSQDSRNINQNFVEKKRTLQEAMNRIHCDTSLLILRENNQYVEWSADINAQFQQWWLQTSVDESVINKTQRKIGNSLWTKKIEVNKQFDIWKKFIQMI